MRNIILTGKMGSGKTAVANELSKLTGFPVLSFAKPVKELTENLLKAKTTARALKVLLMTVPPSFKDKILSEANIAQTVSFLEDFFMYPIEKPKPRKLYQYVGSGLRNLLGNSIWIDLFTAEAKKHKGFIVDDCRYPNETSVKKVFNNTSVVLLKCGDQERVRRMQNLYGDFDLSWLRHESEDSVDSVEYDSYVVNEGSITQQIAAMHIFKESSKNEQYFNL